MRFALVGDDPAVLPLVEAIAADAGHSLTAAACCGSVQGELMRLAPSVRILESWVELLVRGDIDAVIVCGGEDDVLTGARRLAADGTPLVVLPDVRQGAGFAYELALIRDDTGVALVPLFAHCASSAVRELLLLLSSGEAGELVHVELTRDVLPIAEGASAVHLSTPLLDVAQVEATLLHDIVLLRIIGGGYNQVTALNSGRRDKGLAAATVTLAGEGLPEASWTVRPSRQNPSFRLTVTSQHGLLTILGGGDPTKWEPDGGERGTRDTERRASGELAHVVAALAGQPVRPDWTDLTRAFEIVEASRRSIGRRRTIDLHFETASERGQFKTQMTALGCGLLTATLFAVVAVLVLGAAFRGGPDEKHLRELLDTGWTLEQISADPEQLPGYDLKELQARLDRMETGETVMRIARIVVFAPLAAFLLLQLLIFVARPPADRE